MVGPTEGKAVQSMEERKVERLDASIEGSTGLDRDVRFSREITGSLMVPRDRVFELHGTIAHDLIVEVDAGLAYSVAVGFLKNRGGDVRVFGSVRRELDSDQTRPPTSTLPKSIRIGSRPFMSPSGMISAGWRIESSDLAALGHNGDCTFPVLPNGSASEDNAVRLELSGCQVDVRNAAVVKRLHQAVWMAYDG